MIDLLAADAAARQRALEPLSFVVEAPAGAGKTELLTQRTLRLLALVEHPEEVVALTFTNKAAAEMRDRILGSLELAARGPRPGDEAPHRQLTFDLGRAALARDAERGWRLLEHPGRLCVTTLDALCSRLARQMPCLSRFGAQPGVAEDAESHYRSAARRTLALVEDEGPEAEVVARALERLDNDTGLLERLLVALLGRRDQWLPHTARSGEAGLRQEAEAALAALAERDLAAALAAADSRWQQLAMPAVRYAAANLASRQPPPAAACLETWNEILGSTADDLGRWQALAGLALTGKGERRRRLTVNEGFPATPEGKPWKEAFQAAIDALPAGAEEALASLAETAAPSLDDAEWATVECFSRLLNLASAQLWLVFQEAGEVDFGEVALRAIAALGSDEAPTDLALALDYRIRHLLVDEFQDTSPTQARLIAGLTRGWEPGDGRSLFLVGDPMQSIYRFRRADVGLFLKVRDSGLGGLFPERLRLYRNNRSRPKVVEWVNRVFPAVFPAADEPLHGAVRYAPCLATREDEGESGIKLHALIARRDEDADLREAEAVLDLVAANRRQWPEREIAVLVRARPHLAGLVAALRRQAPELRFQAVETEPLGNRQAIQDLLSLTHALLHRADRVHWLAILRAPWCGLSLADLHALAGDDFARTVWQLLQDEARLARLSEDGRARLAPLRAALAEALAQQGRGSPRRWIEGTWRALGGAACLAGAGDHADLAALFELMDRLAATGRFSAPILTEEAAALYAAPDPAPEARSLQLMTIHKAKGLEFDTVIVPGLHRTPRVDDRPLLVWDEIPAATGELLAAAPLPTAGDAGRPSAYSALRRLERERARHEAQRLLYVAATRARRQLHLVGVATLGDSALQAPASSSLLRLLWDADAAAEFAAAAEAHRTAPAQAAADPQDFVPDLLRLPRAALAAPLAPSTAVPVPATHATAGSASAADAAVGSLVHRGLERVAREGADAWSAARLAGLQDSWRQWLRQRGLDAEAARAGALRARTALERCLASPIGRWILARHPEGAAELALSSREEGDVVHHVVDRCFVSGGHRWIVDYKTLRMPAAVPADLIPHAAEHRAQLARYAALFAVPGNASALPLRTAVYFIEQDVLIEFSGDEEILHLPASGFPPPA